ncbi:MAG TPA: anthrone oxygenase family protein, partial [Edaphobacter sp.]|nr:anthrone oxygenase family protein [Edaphobacter sp.]
VINVSFAFQLFGTAAVCIFLGAWALLHRRAAESNYQLAGCLLYLGVTMVATFGFNVPLNDALAKVDPASPEGASLWTSFLPRWIAWNHVRTVGALAAAMSFIGAIFQLGTGGQMGTGRIRT